MTRRRILATLLLPFALVALLLPFHSHHGEHAEAPTRAIHACDCGPGETVPVLAGAHHHDAPDLCWLPHRSPLVSRPTRPPPLVRLPPLPALGEATPGTPLERLPACRGPPRLLA